MEKFVTLIQRKLKSGTGYYYRERDLITGKMGNSAKACPPHVKTLKDAKAFVARRDSELQKQWLGMETGVAMPTAAQSAWTVQQMLEWDNKRTDIAQSTRNVEKCMAAVLVAGLPSGCRVMELNPEILAAYVSQRKEEGRKPRTINLHLQMLKACMNRAVAARKLTRLPVRIARKKKTATESGVFQFVPEPAQQPKSLDESEVAAILAACLKHDNELEPDKYKKPDSQKKRQAKQRLHDTLSLLAYTGLRKGELYGLRWQDVNLRAQEIRVTTYKRGGGGQPHEDTLPMNPVVAEILARLHKEAQPAPSDLVLGIPPEARGKIRNGKQPAKRGSVAGVECYDDYRLGDKLKRLAKLAKVDRWQEIRVHDLRHSYCYALSRAVPLTTVKNLARHRDIKTTERYAQSKMRDMRQAVAGLAYAANVVDIQPAPEPAANPTPENAESYHSSITGAEQTAQAL